MADAPLGPRERAVLQALEMGCTRNAAAGAAGIHRMTLWRMIQDSVTFRDAVEMAEDVAEAKATAIVTKAAYEGQWTAAMTWLERRRPQHYGRRIVIDMNVRDEAQRIGEELGVDADAALAEAEAILREHAG